MGALFLLWARHSMGFVSRLAATAFLPAWILLLSMPTQGTELVIDDTVYLGRQSADDAVHVFLGIPFAQPPVGPLRWAPPQPVTAAPGRRPAAAFKPACAQGEHMVRWYQGVVESFGGDASRFPVPQFSEDCLYLNIWSPGAAREHPRPVLLYIHGGSNKGGWAYEPNYMGENLARLGVVVVTIPYRLGVLGFFAHPELAHANLGLLDQIAALKWVQHNIHAAGGDPHNVTLMGESAGANDIDHLLVSPLATGLFRRVIHQSGGWAVTAAGSRSDSRHLAVTLEQALLEDGAGIAALRKVAVDKVLAGADELFPDHYFDPVVDGSSLTMSVGEALKTKQFESVDLLIGSNADEWLMYLEDTATLDDYLGEEFPDQPKKVAALRDVLSGEPDDLRALDRLITAKNFLCPSLALAKFVDEAGGQTWFYYFARQREGARAATMGAYHGAELPYVFDTHDEWLPTARDDRMLGQRMMHYWVNFMRSGDPNGAVLPEWPRFQQETQQTLILDVTTHSQRHAGIELCEILASKAE